MSEPKIYTSSDFHLGHNNIIKYANRWQFMSDEERAFLSRCKSSDKYPGQFDKDSVKDLRISDASTDRMNNHIIDHVNDVVGREDIFFNLGDFAFTLDECAYYRSRIKCKNVILIIGNHDPHTETGQPKQRLNRYFQGVYTHYFLKTYINGVKQKIFLSHCAHRVWWGSHRGCWALFGHSHGTLPDDPNSLSFDVGWDVWGRVLSLDDVAAKMATKTYKPIDHHAPEENEFYA